MKVYRDNIYDAIEASLRLQRKLNRTYPEFFIYGGLVQDFDTIELSVYCKEEIDVPDEWSGFTVTYYRRGLDEGTIQETTS